jgi:hypothetical protein
MSSFDEYFASLSGPDRAELERIRQLALRVVPDAEEGTSYGMPALKYKGRSTAIVSADLGLEVMS